MGTHRFWIAFIVLMSSCLSWADSGAGERGGVSPGFIITYQGQLKDGGGGFNGTAAMDFRAFDSEVDGSQVGTTHSIAEVPVTDGLFQVDLDLGGNIYDNEGLFLEVTVDGQTLAPRQPITPAPVAAHALSLDSVVANTFWRVGGNESVVGTLGILGTGEAVPLELQVEARPALRIEPRPATLPTDVDDVGPNLIGGYLLNSVDAGVVGATISGGGATLGGTDGPNAIAADSHYSSIGGGAGNNVASGGESATIAGGVLNTVGLRATVGGGFSNTASGDNATVSGGSLNTASNTNSTIGGGKNNIANSSESVVSGGSGNRAIADWASVTGGQGNSATDNHAAVGGGEFNSAERDHATIGGGLRNTVTTAAPAGTISGGQDNTAGGSAAAIGGGAGNATSNSHATIAGGQNNSAGGTGATVGGGIANTAGGVVGTVPGGVSNAAAGDYSLAAGRRAKANHNGTFVWADSTNADFPSGAADEFAVRAGGGVRFVVGSTTCTVTSGDSNWNCTSSSDRHAKADLEAVSGEKALERVASLPLYTWRYNNAGAGDRHFGPMAQDFAAAFALGNDDTRIRALDVAGVALAAIQGLNERNERLEDRNTELASEVFDLQHEVATLDGRLAGLAGQNAELRQRLAALESLLLENQQVAEK